MKNICTPYADNPIDSSSTVNLQGKAYNINGVSSLVDAYFSTGIIFEGFTKFYIRFSMGRVPATADDLALSEAMKTNLKTKSIRDSLVEFAANPAFARAQAPSN